MSTFENKHTFTYRDKEIQIGYDLDMRENAIRGHHEVLPPIRTPNIYIDYKPILISTGLLPALRKGLEGCDYTEIEDLVKQRIDALYG